MTGAEDTASGGVLTDVKYAGGTASPVSVIVSNAAGAWSSGASDPMMGIYLYPILRSGPISVTVSNLTPGLYDLYFYAHGQTAVENGVVHVTTGGVDYGTKSTTTNADWNTPDWQEGRQYVRFQGILVNSGELLQIQVDPGSAGLAVMNGLQLLAATPSLAPLAHWRFEETDGTVVHDSAGAFSGNLSPTGTTFLPGGIAGRALYVDRSSNGFVNMGRVLGLESGDFSLVAWIKMSPGDTTESCFIVGKHASGYPNGYGLFANSSAPFGLPGRAWFYDSGWSGQEVISTTTVNDGFWHQVVGVYQAGGGKQIYVDGAPAEASASAVPIVGNTGDFLVAAFNSNAGPTPAFTGWIDEIQVYGHALAASEVDFLFQNPAQELLDCAAPPSGLVGWWRGEHDASDTSASNEGSAENGLGYAAGQDGQAFLLDGVDDEVLIPASPTLNVRSFTIEGWINPSDVAEQRPVVEWCATNDYAGVHLWISVVPQGGASLPGTLWANVRDAANGTHLLTSAPGLIASNQWSHVALTYDEASGNARLHLNGATVASADLGTFVPKTGVPLHLGRRPTSCYETWPSMVPFAGRLDEISLYNRAFSPTEIEAVFAAGSAGKCPPPPPTTPEITVNPASQRAPRGSDVTFRVTATGTPPLFHQWYFITNALEGATNDLLVLANIQAVAAGGYSVVVSNAFGAATSAVAQLTVTFPPVITVQPQSQSVVIGSRVVLSVTAEGAEPFSYAWRRNGLSVPGGTGQILILNNVQIPQSGTYTVRVTNADGATISAPAVLKVGCAQLNLVMSKGVPQLNVVGQAGGTYEILISSDLTNWSTLASEVTPSTNWFFSDEWTAGADRRFYRLRRTP
jgi:hypothetical protein